MNSQLSGIGIATHCDYLTVVGSLGCLRCAASRLPDRCGVSRLFASRSEPFTRQMRCLSVVCDAQRDVNPTDALSLGCLRREASGSPDRCAVSRLFAMRSEPFTRQMRCLSVVCIAQRAVHPTDALSLGCLRCAASRSPDRHTIRSLFAGSQTYSRSALYGRIG